MRGRNRVCGADLRHRGSWTGISVLLMVCVCRGVSGAGQFGAEAQFNVLETEHFTIRYDTSRETVTALAGRLEATYEAVRRFCEPGTVPATPSTSHLKVVFFARCEDFARFAQSAGFPAGSAAGFYSPTTGQVAFCNVLDTPDLRRITETIEQLRRQMAEAPGGKPECQQDRGPRRVSEQTAARLSAERDALADRFNRLVIQHEVAHQVLHNLKACGSHGSGPPWFLEGLACQFEALPGDREAGAPGVNQMRLADLREALGVSPDADSVSEDAYQKALENGRVMSPADLVSKPELLAKDGGNLAYRYAQSWALVYYLRNKHDQDFTRYLRMRGAGQVSVKPEHEIELEAFRAAFGEPDDTFRRQWLGYVLRLPFDPTKAGR